MEYKTRKIGDENVRYLHKGNKKPLFLLHGFGVRAYKYHRLIDKLSEKYEVIAPDLYGINYLKNQPSTIKHYTELTHYFCSSFSKKDFHIVGHSIGASVAFEIAENSSETSAIVGINPILPINYGNLGFIINTLYKERKEWSEGVIKKLKEDIFGNRISVNFLYHLIKNPITTAKIGAKIKDFDFKNLNVPQPTLILFGEKDEYFKLDEIIEKEISKGFKKLEIKRKKGLIHNWPIMNPDIAAKEIREFLSWQDVKSTFLGRLLESFLETL